jgi:hypothetical protein
VTTNTGGGAVTTNTGGGAVTTNTELFARAQRVIPGGVNSPVRAFRSVGGDPYFVARGNGAYVWDVEGTRYIDYVQSYGASILGHAHPAPVEAIRAAALDGTTFGAPTERGCASPRSSAHACPVSRWCGSRRRAPKRRCPRCASHVAPRAATSS